MAEPGDLHKEDYKAMHGGETERSSRSGENRHHAESATLWSNWSVT